MSIRLFEEFQKKNVSLKVGSLKTSKAATNSEEIVISIPLKNSQNGKPQELNEDFIKVIEYEYAVRYLEIMGIEPNQKMIQNLLKKQPLSSCELSSGWNNSGSLADVLYIYPNKRKKKTFENNREELLMYKNLKEPGTVRNKGKSESAQMNTYDEKHFRGMLEEKKPMIGADTTKKLFDSIPAYKKKAKQYELQKVKQDLIEQAAEAKRKDLNMNVEQWKNKFLYPFGNIAPIFEKNEIPLSTKKEFDNELNNKQFNSLVSKKYLFPLEKIHKHEWLVELQEPISITAEDIARDLYKFVKDFPVEVIPHMTEDEMIAKSKERDQMKPKTLEQLMGDQTYKQTTTSININENQNKSPSVGKSNPLHFDKQLLNCHHVQIAFKEIHSDRTARLIGLITHFVYWVVFGHVNQLPLDNFHLKQLFVSILQQITQLEMRHDKKRIFTSFIMPMVLLAIRIEVENIFKNNYSRFMGEEEMEELALRLINGAITEILDPKIYYSRFSFLESGKDAIDLKYRISKKSNTADGFQLPNVKNKYYTRSTLLKNLIPFPSEGKVRALFGETPSFSLPKIQKIRFPDDSKSPERMSIGQNTLQDGRYFSENKSTKNTSPAINKNNLGLNKFMDFNTEAKNKAANEELQREARLLDMINKVQMFQIAGEKVNKSLQQRKLSPVFQLRINEVQQDQSNKRKDIKVENHKMDDDQ